MVNHGRLKGCNTCRRRRVKCDEKKPVCSRCINGGFACLGYERNDEFVQIRFKDETDSVRQRKSKPRNKPSVATVKWDANPEPADQTAIAPIMLPDGESVSLGFFIRNFATTGRSIASCRGFFENVVPMLHTAPSDSATSLAAYSVATFMFSRFRREQSIHEMAMRCLGRALKRLRNELNRPASRIGPPTLMAILMLQFQDNLAAAMCFHPAARTHQEGALALVMKLPPKILQSYEGRRLLQYLLSTEVSTAIREQRSLSGDFASRPSLLSESWQLNPAGRLDLVGIMAAEIQSRFRQLIKLHSFYCIITLRVLAHIRSSAWFDEYGGEKSNNSEVAVIQRQLGSTVDAILASVPFHLGNRTSVPVEDEHVKEGLVFPGYHNSHSQISSKLWESSDGIMPQEDHNRHAVSMGPWHILIPLTFLVTRMYEWEICCDSCRGLVQQDQLEFSRDHLLRSMMLMNISRAEIVPVGFGKTDTFVFMMKLREAMGMAQVP
ncbi:hypothetical protein BS50DRAFT_681674 [Corynespora cassiicola Philippines]|uniref:Zn(2)-C6 fungal-type domain-containing protein n=1 Tax=Corynespora cassiicola Philippines TaxID=1448308 RepID=A0A2T2N3X1_CORCC|nr:hypothetical protein BS50DRAFT_681674 [Corynespora cassiicola Philippines]